MGQRRKFGQERLVAQCRLMGLKNDAFVLRVHDITTALIFFEKLVVGYRLAHGYITGDAEFAVALVAGHVFDKLPSQLSVRAVFIYAHADGHAFAAAIVTRVFGQKGDA